MSSKLHDDEDDPLDAPPARSGDAMTPRGGFMARPGFKTPPRHAVVVRVGDAPESEHIPLLRSSCPPPPPTDEAAVSEAGPQPAERAAHVARDSEVSEPEALPAWARSRPRVSRWLRRATRP